MTAIRLHRAGFSLIELMVSMAVGAIILIVAASMLGASGDGYERIGGSVAAEREGRSVMNQLASDLSSAQFHQDSKFEKSSIGFLSLQPASAQSDDGRIGDLCAVNYYLDDLDIGGKKLRCLMRGFRESKESFDALRDEDTKPLFDKEPGVDEPIAFGVISFQALPKTLGENGEWIDWVKDDEAGPEAMEIKLVIARRRLAGQLKTAADWDAAGDTNKQHEMYSTIIRFGNHVSSR